MYSSLSQRGVSGDKIRNPHRADYMGGTGCCREFISIQCLSLDAHTAHIWMYAVGAYFGAPEILSVELRGTVRAGKFLQVSQFNYQEMESERRAWIKYSTACGERRDFDGQFDENTRPERESMCLFSQPEIRQHLLMLKSYIVVWN